MSEILSSGVELMLLGMSTVFVFLTILVVATTLMSSILGKQSAAEAEHNRNLVSVNTTADQEIAAVAAAAFAQHRKNVANH